MKFIILTSFGLLVLSACSFFGFRSGYGQPSYNVVDRVGENLEVRRYAPRLAAEARVDASDEKSGRDSAFRLLFDYISGENSGATEIAMTTPVESSQDSRKIAMTTPVETSNEGDDHVMRFFLPSDFTWETAPQPTDTRVELIEVPEQLLAVVRFSGARDENAVNSKKTELLQALGATQWKPMSEPTSFFYDPPWTLPFLRRNEVAVTVIKN